MRNLVALSLLFVGPLAAACSLETQGEGMDPEGEALGEVEQPVYGGGDFAHWSPGNIPVCFGQAGNDDLRYRTREIVEDNWGRTLTGRNKFSPRGNPPAGVPAIAWGTTCSEAHPPNTIKIQFVANTFKADRFGPDSSTATEIRLPNNDLSWYFRHTVLHEFGHALGLVHEQERPDNWTPTPGFFPVVYKPIYCGQKDAQAGIEDFRSGGNYYTSFDKGSIMNYCANGNPNFGVLTPADVWGTQRLYGVPGDASCQYLSDTYGITYNVGYAFATPGAKAKWDAMKCTTTPSSSDHCQKASDLYGIDAGVGWGYAPQSVRTWWTTNACNTKPLDSKTLCQRAADKFRMIPGQTNGTAPTEVVNWWKTSACQTQPSQQDTCQNISDMYGIYAGWTFGWAPAQVQAQWTKLNCMTSPSSDPAPSAHNTSSFCQVLSDNYGLSNADKTAAAPQAARDAWVGNACNTVPKSTNVCQRISDTFGTTAWVGWGSAPAEVQQSWTAHNCATTPTRGKEMCQVLADRYGIVGEYPFWGAATNAVISQFVQLGCMEAKTRSKFRVAIPG